jgi:hypothetical protein
MGILNWFKPDDHDDGQRADGAGTNDPPGATVGGLNFMTAIDAHLKWKTRLERYIGDPSQEHIQVEVVGRDDACQLGQWIHGSGGEQFGNLDAFVAMKVQHANFHACAGKVLSAAQLGRKQDALRMLQQGDYACASERVKMLLAKLYVQIIETGSSR